MITETKLQERALSGVGGSTARRSRYRYPATNIECSLNCKVALRESDSEAQAVKMQQFAANGTSAEAWGDRPFWTATPEHIATLMRGYLAVGFRTFICELLPPYVEETLIRLVEEVKPLVERD